MRSRLLLLSVLAVAPSTCYYHVDFLQRALFACGDHYPDSDGLVVCVPVYTDFPGRVIPVFDSAKFPNVLVLPADAFRQLNGAARALIGRDLIAEEWDILINHPWIGYAAGHQLDSDMVQRAAHLIGYYSGDLSDPWFGEVPYLWSWSPRPIAVE